MAMDVVCATSTSHKYLCFRMNVHEKYLFVGLVPLKILSSFICF